MRNENEFNSFLTRHFRKHSKRMKAIKSCDRFTPGVSDFLLWFTSGVSSALESKYIDDFVKDDKKNTLTKHPFTPAQINFLRDLDGKGCKAYGIVAVKDLKKMFLLPFSLIDGCAGKPSPTQVKQGLELPLSPQGVEALIIAIGG